MLLMNGKKQIIILGAVNKWVIIPVLHLDQVQSSCLACIYPCVQKDAEL